MTKNKIVKYIEELLTINNEQGDNLPSRATHLYMGCISIYSQLYGSQSIQMQELKEEKKRAMELPGNEYTKQQYLIRELHGFLNNLLNEINNGLLVSVQDEAKSEVYADFILFAKESIEEDYKDVAAVLASAALEGSLKSFATSKDMNTEGMDMSKIISSLKSEQLLKKPEAKILQSYVTLRNKAFHAEWGKINMQEVSSLIGYVEKFNISKRMR